MTPRPLPPRAIPVVDVRTVWAVEKRPRFGWWVRAARGFGLPEKSTGFAWTRAGAERKARRWSR